MTSILVELKYFGLLLYRLIEYLHKLVCVRYLFEDEIMCHLLRLQLCQVLIIQIILIHNYLRLLFNTFGGRKDRIVFNIGECIRKTAGFGHLDMKIIFGILKTIDVFGTWQL